MKTTASGRKKLYVLCAACAVLLLLVSGRYYRRIDLTKEKRFSISPISKTVLNGLTEPLRVTYYASAELKNVYPHVRDVSDYLYAYAAENELITVSVADPASRQLESTLAALGIPGRQISSARKNKTELLTVYSAIVLEYREKTAVIPFILSADTLEYELTGRVMPLTQNGSREVYLMTGNGLSVETDYSYTVPWLESAGFSCTVLEPAEFERILSDLVSGTGVRTPLLLFGSAELNASEAAAVEAFALAGGNVFCAVSPNTADIYGGWEVSPVSSDVLIPVLESWGFGFSDALAADRSCFRMTLLSNTEPPVYEYRDYPLWIVPEPQYAQDSPLARTAGALTFFWASPLELTDSALQPVFRTTPQAYLSVPDPTETPAFITSPFLTDNVPAGGTGQYVLAAAYEGAVSGYYTAASDTASPDRVSGPTGQSGRNSARIIVVPDQYFTATPMLDYTGASGNLDFLVNAALYLSGDDGLLSLRGKAAREGAVYKTDAAGLAAARTPVLALTALGIPLACAAAGAAFAVFRTAANRKRASKSRGGRRD